METITHYGRQFNILAQFIDVDECNQYLQDHPNAGVLCIVDGEIYVADCDDKGTKK